MRLGTVTLPRARMGRPQPAPKRAIHSPDWSSTVTVTDMGDGPTIIPVFGLAAGEEELNDVIAACEDARRTDTHLYFPSTQEGEGEVEDDRFYIVRTGPAVYEPGETVDTYLYEIECIALVPYRYDADTGERVT